ncbi:hypothetical protein MCP_2186 [Methanocella paludicola SANAE]|uniref:FAS1 domain-containing protein n=1 Tax=Methanocella paludicola (strain DSM 17711 / JCM 13418 / NBRC 101707 / SANAE) TaxID=304371 RepID=D1Z0N6_METPS|nr:fasciclin domain-containing protein [Methanocella paludicola]BAI62258.1 hypothetical protein MCP_2186 [Methanocella paludicola SANAE]
MDGLKSILAVFTIIALFMITPAGAQVESPFGDSPWETGPGMMGSPFGSPFGGMFPGMMPFGMSVEQYKAPATETSEKSIMATMESVPQLSMFTAALRDSGYAEKLDGRGTYMVFAPPDKSLQRDLGVRDAASLLENAALSLGLAENGVVLNASEPDEHSKELSLTAASGRPINVRKEKTGMAANGADVIKVFKATNGYVIVTDAAVGT